MNFKFAALRKQFCESGISFAENLILNYFKLITP